MLMASYHMRGMPLQAVACTQAELLNSCFGMLIWRSEYCSEVQQSTGI